MDDLKLLQEFRAAVAPPDDAMLARARARMLDGQTAGAGWRARWPRLPGTRPRLALTGLAAAATAAALTLTLAQPGGGPTRPATLTVKELAYRAAAAAAARPPVAPGQWVYWHETAIDVQQVGSPPQQRGQRLRGTYQVWTTADATKAALIDNGKIRFLCPTDVIPPQCHGPLVIHGHEVRIIGQPIQLSFNGVRMTEFQPGSIPVSYADLNSLPRNPVALDRYFASLHQPGQSPADSEFQTIAELLVSYVMPPSLTAELYHAMADVPGVTVNDHAVDAAGRTGLGLQMSNPAYPMSMVNPFTNAELVLDPRTYEWMGYQFDVGDQSGPATAVLNSALVSGPGVVP